MPERPVRFGECELNASSLELRRGRRTVKLERIPLQVLLTLIEQHGKVVTRDAIADQIWGKSVFVVDNGINTAIRKIRQALHDHVQRPRFVETISGIGYRFIAALDPADGPVLMAEPAHHEVAPPVDGYQIEACRLRVCDPELPRDARIPTQRPSSGGFETLTRQISLVEREEWVAYATKLLLDPHVRLLSFVSYKLKSGIVEHTICFRTSSVASRMPPQP